MANSANTNEVVLTSFQVKTTANVEYTKRQAKAFGKFLEQLRGAAVENLLPPNDKMTLFIKALPSIEDVVDTFMEPTEGYEDIVWEINISQKGVLQTPTVVVEE